MLATQQAHDPSDSHHSAAPATSGWEPAPAAGPAAPPAWLGDASGLDAAVAGVQLDGTTGLAIFSRFIDIQRAIDKCFEERINGAQTLVGQAEKQDPEERAPWWAALLTELLLAALGPVGSKLGGFAAKATGSALASNVVAGTTKLVTLASKKAATASSAAAAATPVDSDGQLPPGLDPCVHFASLQVSALNAERQELEQALMEDFRALLPTLSAMAPAELAALTSGLVAVHQGWLQAAKAASGEQFRASLGAWGSYLARADLRQEAGAGATDLGELADLERFGRDADPWDEQAADAEEEGTVAAVDAAKGVLDVRVFGSDRTLVPTAIRVRGLNRALRDTIANSPMIGSLGLPLAVHGRVYHGATAGLVSLSRNESGAVRFDADDDGLRFLAGKAFPDRYRPEAGPALDDAHGWTVHIRGEEAEEQAVITAARRWRAYKEHVADNGTIGDNIRLHLAEHPMFEDAPTPIERDAQLGAEQAMAEVAMMPPSLTGVDD